MSALLLCCMTVVSAPPPETVPDAGSYEIEITDPENAPLFQGGGLQNFRSWVMQRINYPQKAAEEGIQGTVIVEFYVGVKGDIEELRVLQTPDPILSEEVRRVIRTSPRWTPGTSSDGTPLRMQFTLPIQFKLQY